MTNLLLIALGTFLSEDLTCVATGVLVAKGELNLVEGILACASGIFIGDMLLYIAGRIAGPKLIDPQRLTKAQAWIAKRGMNVVFLSRFTPGLRLPTYVAAGLLKTPAKQFALYCAIAALVWTPIVVTASAKAWIVAVAVVLLANLRHLKRWEHWPPWATYAPLIPYLLYLAVKHRSLTVFTAANPTIFSGGLVGESKSDILNQLDPDAIADFTMLGRELRTPFPVVLKPDVGQRGQGVAVIRNEEQLAAYRETASANTIVQTYIPGVEFGVFYYRYPDAATGTIFSITEKHFPPGLEIGSHCRGCIFLNGAKHNTPELQAALDRITKPFYFGRYDIRAESVEAFRQGRFKVIEFNGVSAEATHIYDPAISVREAYRVMREQWRIAFTIGAMNRARGAKPLSLREALQHFLRAHPTTVSNTHVGVLNQALRVDDKG